MYKIIAVDLDGTLLDSSGEVSINTRKALKRAMDKRNRNSNCISEELLNQLKNFLLIWE